MTDQPESPLADVPPKRARPVPWAVVWWCVLAVAVGLWFAGNFGAGVSWQAGRLPVVPEGQTWSAAGVGLTSNAAKHGTTITVSGQNPYKAAPGAVYVVVAIDYTLTAADLNQSCSMALVGNGRSWLSTDAGLPLGIGDVLPGVTATCSGTDSAGDPALSGTMGALFEIPESALGEIQGVQVSVQNAFTWADLQQATPVFDNPASSAILKITVQ